MCEMEFWTFGKKFVNLPDNIQLKAFECMVAPILMLQL